jgi:hypothetical protein
VLVKKDELGNDMIYPWKAGSYVGVIVYLELDNRKCTVMEGALCFPSANEVCWQQLYSACVCVCGRCVGNSCTVCVCVCVCL